MDTQRLYSQRLNFFVNEENFLVAVLTPGPPLPQTDNDSIRKKLKEEGFEKALIDEKAIVELIHYCVAGNQQLYLNIGQIVHASFELRVADDKMSAYMAVKSPHGGAILNRDVVYEAIRSRGIVFGLITETIESALKEMSDKEYLIARGVHPTAGQDALFTSLIPDKPERKSSDEDEWGFIDYRDFNDLISVEPGTPLMDRIPPTAGTPGRNVLGDEIPAKPGLNTQYSPGLKGVEFHPEDPNRLIAKMPGQPICLPHGMHVEPLLTMRNVDLSTGNVSFSGSLKILGNVSAGMKVKAKADIHIGGGVESADIQAEGNITILGGVIGPGTEGENKRNTANFRAYIHSGGTVALRFAENAQIEAKESILVQDSVLNCTLLCSNKIVVGSRTSSKGMIAGGKCHAGTQVEAMIIGTMTEVETIIMIGLDPTSSERFESMRNQIRLKNRDRLELQKSLEHYYRVDPVRAFGKIRDIQASLEQLQSELQTLTQQFKELKKGMAISKKAKLIVNRRINPGCTIQMGDKKIRTYDQLQSGTYYWSEEGICFSPQVMR